MHAVVSEVQSNLGKEKEPPADEGEKGDKRAKKVDLRMY